MTNSLLENTLARSGDLMASFTRPPPMFTRQCERASGILHPCLNIGCGHSFQPASCGGSNDRPHHMSLCSYGEVSRPLQIYHKNL